MKPIAPQGEWLRDRLLADHKEIIFIFMGTKAEERARGFLPELPYTIYLPFRTSPYAYTWPVNGCEVYLTDTDLSSGLFLKTFVMCLFMHGATLIHYLSKKYSQTFRRS
jgi:hypothetical protein